MNSRVGLSAAATAGLLAVSGVDRVLPCDEMLCERRLLTDYIEAPIDFLPTYRLSKTGEFDLARTPSWCDRVVWRTRRGGPTVQPLAYVSPPVHVSDHRPVALLLAVSAGSVPSHSLHGAHGIKHEVRSQETPLRRVFPSLPALPAVVSAAELDTRRSVPAVPLKSMSLSGARPSVRDTAGSLDDLVLFGAGRRQAVRVGSVPSFAALQEQQQKDGSDPFSDAQ
jgi:hypothetical protein